MKKNILIDLYKIKDLYSGLGQFSFNYANEITPLLSEHYNINFLVPHNEISFGNQVNHIQENIIKRYLPNSNPNYDLWHSMNQFPSHLPNKNTKQLLNVHDLNFLEEKEGWKINKYLKILQKNVDRADELVVISNFTKQILQGHINTKNKAIHVIHIGIKLEAHQKNLQEQLAIKNKFFFSISVFKEKKNFEAIIPIMKNFPEHQLVIAGNNHTPYGQKIKELIRELNLENQVILSGKVSDEEKYWLYNNCEAFLFPSKAEGFGMPVIEAMICGKPTFLSTWASLPEIGGTAAFYFDDFDTDNMSKIIKSNLDIHYQNQVENADRIKAYAQQFNWENCIKKYVEVYEGMIS